MLPVTFLYEFKKLDEYSRQTAMYEFAANGAKHLVLTDSLIKMICGDPKLYRKLSKEMADAGLDFVDAHAPFRDDCDMLLPIPEMHDYVIARMKLTLQIVHDFGVKTCTIHIGNQFYDGYTEEQHRDATCRSLDELLPFAEKKGITVCIENLTRMSNNVDDLLFFFDRYHCDNFGACFDAGHANIMEKGMNVPECAAVVSFINCGVPVRWEKDVLKRMLPYIVTCHIHDNDATRDQHLLPGKGTVDWDKLLPELLSAPRLSCIQSEVKSVTNHNPIKELCGKFVELFGEI